MKFTMTKIAAGLVLAAAATGAQAVAINSITITGGSFSMGQYMASDAGCSSNPGDFNSFKCLTGGAGNTLNAGDGLTPKTDAAAYSPSATQFNFFGNPVTSGLNSLALGAAPANDWALGFQGDTTTGLNLGGFYANWNGTNFLQGTNSTGANGTSTLATGNFNNDGTFDVFWHSYITTAPFAGQTGYWHISGTYTADAAAPIPEASTYGMMLAGLGLVGGVVARRRKLMA